MIPLYATVQTCAAFFFFINHLQVSEYIAECARILDKSGLKYQVRTLLHSVSSYSTDTAAATIRCSTFAFSIHFITVH